MAAVVAISTAAIAIRLADALPPVWVAAGRVSITALALAPFCVGELTELFSAFRKRPVLLVRSLAAGALLALHFGTWIASLSMTSVVTSVALVATQPLFAAGLGRLLGDRVPWQAYAGALAAIVGGYVMSGAQVGSGMGAGLALAGAFFAAAYLAVGRSLRDGVPLGGYFVVVNAIAAAMLAGVGCWTGVPTSLDWGDAWPYVVYLGLVPGVVGHGLLNWAVRRVELHIVSLLVLLEPIGAGVLAWFWLREAPSAAEILGGCVLLFGVAIGARSGESEGADSSA
jgi:drug/metabolite transporter (DMT)-like permease